MFRTNRFWFLRFVEGADGAQAGGNGQGDAGGDKGGSGAGQVDWEARAKELEADRDKWKGHSRTWEDRAKENQSAAEKLKDLEDADKSDFEKLQAELEKERSDRAKEREELTKAKREALVATVATEEGVAKDDWKFLTDEDEETLREHAKRLAKSGGAEDPNQGRGNSAGRSREDFLERVKKL